ncbi:uncharacterized protein LOC126979461 isoform X2 [Leptidea sinapis]|uniref:uncharacterized protein LOC126979461 isoform X2 n=1 Tax=Leptidea sinapis TaxID=189913 RepID=UPI0021C499D0|nr:uncharacterized protein LOC126979461 isoform X2 [Leptidea sinapis]
MELGVKMNYWIVAVFVIGMSVNITLARSINAENVRRLIDLVKRRSPQEMEEEVLSAPATLHEINTEEAEDDDTDDVPGHALINPKTAKMLESASKFPKKDLDRSVYGNLANLGITYNKTNNRIRYTSFRKLRNVVKEIVEAIRRYQSRRDLNDDYYQSMEVNRIEPLEDNDNNVEDSNENVEVPMDENNASEIRDDTDEDLSGTNDYRRRRKLKTMFRKRPSSESSSSSEHSSSSGSSDYEKNAGNPYTLYKDKYKQNWPWNHQMDGDHMNVNPLAPEFQNQGPSGASLFFGRKWWYFNQDDFQPMQ